MNHLQGKVKSISVKEVPARMQLLTPIGVRRVGKAEHIKEDSILINGVWWDRVVLKTLVVECEETVVGHDRYGEQEADITRILPLKHSQWQSAIDNGEVDSDKEVRFEILNTPGPNEYAKIIPQKKRMYSEEEVISLMWLSAQHVSKRISAHKNAVIMRTEIINLFNENK